MSVNIFRFGWGGGFMDLSKITLVGALCEFTASDL